MLSFFDKLRGKDAKWERIYPSTRPKSKEPKTTQ
jgi:hypothetical protein